VERELISIGAKAEDQNCPGLGKSVVLVRGGRVKRHVHGRAEEGGRGQRKRIDPGVKAVCGEKKPVVDAKNPESKGEHLARENNKNHRI